jgi:polysaccharide export outer membrane protein
MLRVLNLISAAICAACIGLLGGCSSGDYLDPTQVGRFRPVPQVNFILDSLGVADETPSTFAGAEEPKPVDAMATEEDYVFHSGDTVRISIWELQQEGQQYINDFVVTETGKISIPDVGVIQAEGLTEAQLEEEIRNILSPAILREPLVTAILQNSQSRTFTILGDGVPQPNRYPIPRYDFRLADALATAGSPKQFNVSYIYVSRSVTGKEPEPAAAAPPQPEQQPQTNPVPEANQAPSKPGGEDDMMQIIAPHVSAKPKTERVIAADDTVETAQPATQPFTNEIDKDLENMAENNAGTVRNAPAEPNRNQTSGPVEWIFQDGRWKPVQPGAGSSPEQPTQMPAPIKPQKKEVPEQTGQNPPQGPASYGFEQIGSAGVQKRVIKIPVKDFLGGDPRYNIIIHPGDVIYVPVDIVGEYYVLGNTNNQGVINITGRPITLMQAIAAAGGLGPLAWPDRVEVRRRIGEKKEEIVLVNLKKIADGEQPDFFIKPNDTINVGTHPAARWLAVLRNAFRATYGFGFIYDRNFAQSLNGETRSFDLF